MAKAIKWQIPFASLSGTLYRIDIYAEGYSGDPIQLTAGESPFVTEEDSSEDFFAPIRTQTGSIQVCTSKPDGTMLTLDEILPANNIDHPVRLINLSNSNAIEWQGFLSCEAYSQNYTAIPENLTLSVISVLEAMDSVQLDQTRSSGLATIAAATYYALNEIVVQSGMDFFTHIRYSMTSWRIFNKYIDQTVFFERKEYDNENSTTYIVSGLSAKAALERLCTFMGWTAREQGTQLYLEYIGESIGMYQETFSGFGLNFHPSGTPSAQITSSDIADFDWRGTDHKRDIRQGAKSVAVAAKLEKYELEMELPECPVGDLQTYSGTSFKTIQSSAGPYGQNISIDSQCNKNDNFTNMCSFLCYAMTETARIGAATTIENVLSCALVNPSANTMGQLYNDGRVTYWYNPYIGSFVSKLKKGDDDYIDGLYIVGMREAYSLNAISSTNHLFEIRSITLSEFNSGNLKLKCNAITIYSGDTGRVWGDYNNRKSRLRMCLKFGDKYWNGSSWASSFASFLLNDNELTIPVNTRLKGEVFIRLYGYMDDFIIPADYEQGFASDQFISELSLDYEPDESDIATDRSENHYFRLLGTNFRDEISINAELASMLNNQPSPSLIMDDATTPASSIDYTVSGGTESRRPEVDLLNRLASYYGASRQTLDLITKHPVVNNAAAVLPLLKLNGIGDGKTYLPLSESRDWRNEECTLKCFEMPDTSSES